MNVVITGASEGIGKAIAHLFAAHQYNLFLIARQYENLIALQSELHRKHKTLQVDILPIDLSIKKNIPLVVKGVLEKMQTVDILINNAGQFIPNDFLNSNEDDNLLDKMLRVNLYSAYYLTKAFVPTFLQQQQGHIFNMCSIASLQAYSNSEAYSISKYALLGFTKNLRLTLQDKGIKVTAVLPGATMTRSWDGSGIPAHRIMQAEDIAKMILAASQLSKSAVVEDIILRPQQGDL